MKVPLILKGSFSVMQDSFLNTTGFFKNILLTYVFEKNVYLPGVTMDLFYDDG